MRPHRTDYSKRMGNRLVFGDRLDDRVRKALEERPLAELWREASPVAGGRGTARVVALGGLSVVLKRESRGGWAGALLPDLYLRTGPFLAEWDLSCHLFALGLYPRPVAQQFVLHGPLARVYHATEEVEGGGSLGHLWHEGRLEASALRRAGAAVAALHRGGVLHGDLNAGNLLIAPVGRVLFLDLRHSRRTPGPPSREDREQNLTRLGRSLHKLHATWGLPWPRGVWSSLAEGYAESWGPREPWLDAWVDRSPGGFPLRSLLWRRAGSR